MVSRRLARCFKELIKSGLIKRTDRRYGCSFLEIYFSCNVFTATQLSCTDNWSDDKKYLNRRDHFLVLSQDLCLCM